MSAQTPMRAVASRMSGVELAHALGETCLNYCAVTYGRHSFQAAVVEEAIVRLSLDGDGDQP